MSAVIANSERPGSFAESGIRVRHLDEKSGGVGVLAGVGNGKDSDGKQWVRARIKALDSENKAAEFSAAAKRSRRENIYDEGSREVNR